MADAIWVIFFFLTSCWQVLAIRRNLRQSVTTAASSLFFSEQLPVSSDMKESCPGDGGVVVLAPLLLVYLAPGGLLAARVV